MAICGGRDFEAPTNQTVTILSKVQTVGIPTSPGLRILRVTCWHLLCVR
jgi:hypothetical protein